MRYLSLIIILVAFSCFAQAQNVGIGTTTPDPSAILELKSTTQGFLMPRMTTAQRDAIPSPAQGLKIINLDDQCEDTYADSTWSKDCNISIVDTVTLPPNNWSYRADFPGGKREGAISFVINGKAYVGTGYDSISYKKDLWEYNPTNNVWTRKADFPGTARWQAVAFTINGKGYVGTGNDGVRKKDFWEYNPTTNTWTQKADFGGTARQGTVGFAIGSFGYIGTGAGNVNFKDFWQYSVLFNTWTQKADFGGTARTNAVGMTINGKGYIGTGHDGAYKKDFWEYTSSTNTWTQKADFGGKQRSNANAFSTSTNGFIGLGFDGTYLKDIWSFLPTTNTWTLLTDFAGAPRQRAVAFAINTSYYVGLGFDDEHWSDLWEYNTTPKVGYVYHENLPAGTVNYVGHDWTTEGNKLYTSKYVNAEIRGNLHVSEKISSGSSVASGLKSIAFGSSTASGSNSAAFGNSIANGNNSVAFGSSTANKDYSLTCGFENLALGNLTGNLFEIGNGDNITPHNAFEVRSSGHTKIISSIEASNTSNGALMIGTPAQNIVVDGNTILSRTNGASSTLYLQKTGGGLNIGNYTSGSTSIFGSGDASLSNHGILVVGQISSNNIVMDQNEIMARNNGTTSGLFLQNNGGDVILGNASSLVDINGALTVNDSVGIGTLAPDQRLSVMGNASKTGGGAWAAFSDRRLKQDISSYRDGLQAALSINPVRYRYNTVSDYDTAQYHIGVIAQELKEIAPYMVSTSKKVFKDGSTDYLNVDNSAMTYMLINTIKELAQKNEELNRKCNDLQNQNGMSKAATDAELLKLRALLSELKESISSPSSDKK